MSDVILFGHSQGGLVAGILAGELGEEKVPYLIQMAPAVAAKDLAFTGTLGKQKVFDPENIPDEIRVANGFTISKEYILTANKLPIYETAANYKGKVLLLQGKADIVVNLSYAEKYNDAYINCDLKLIDNEDHNFSINTDESVNYIMDFLMKM